MGDNTIIVNIIDREGNKHSLAAPTDMNMNIMEVCKSYELPVKEHVEAWPCAQRANVT